MRRAMLIAAAIAFGWSAAGAQELVPTLQQLSTQAANLTSAIRRTQDAAARRRLQTELEKVRHQMGPFDVNGKRVTCQAMWHHSALEALGTEIKRLEGGPASSYAAQAPVARGAQLQIRRMAAACLTQGWRIYTGRPKYQVDAFGQYLANNSRLLDAMLESLKTAEIRLAKAAPPDGDRADAADALEKAKQGVDQMARAADAMAKEAKDPLAELVPLLGQFLEGLAAVRDAEQRLSASGRKTEEAPAKADPPPEEPVEPAEAPPMTDEEKAVIAQVRALAAALEGDDWTPITRSLESFAGRIEAGFTVASARPKVRELLEQVRQAAELVESLRTSKAVGPEYLKLQQDELAKAFGWMEDPTDRAAGYAKLQATAQSDHVRRQIEMGGLPAEAAKALVNTYYVLVPQLTATATAIAVGQAQQARRSCLAIADTFEKKRGWLPNDMSPKLRDCYRRQEGIFQKAVEDAALLLPASVAEAIPILVDASERAGDLALIVRAETVVKAVKKYRPIRAGAMYAQVSRAAQDLVLGYAAPAPPRRVLTNLVHPFEALDSFPMPEAEYRRAATRLGGRAYNAAAGRLSQELGVGIDAAASGNPVPLRQAVLAQHLFGLMRTRAIAETYRLDRAGVTNLVAFSVPEKVWKPFLEATDEQMRLMFAEYAKNGHRGFAVNIPASWEGIYAAVAAGQRQTLDGRIHGETQRDLLLRNLERVAAHAPTAPTYYNWFAGYHAVEAAVTLMAGLDGVADWHRTQMRGYDRYLRLVELVPPAKTADDAK